MSHDMPTIVADYQVVQDMNARPEYLGQNPDILHKQDSLPKGYGKTLKSVLFT